MTETADNQAKSVRKEDLFDVAAVDAVLKEKLSGLNGTPEIGQFSAGASNLTYALDYPGRRLILRCPPHGAKPASGHSMIREYRVVKALKPVFPAVPPVLYYADAENSVIGKEFYVMERVEGPILRTTLPEDWGWGPQEAEKFCRLFWEKLVDLHQVDYIAIGLGDFGKPKGYVARQVEGWNKRFETALTPDVQPFEDVRDWLDHNQPEDCPQSSLLHGDYRIDNVILNPENPFDIRAVLDWELAALGDPLMDLGAALAYWIEPDDPPELRVLERQPSRAPGMLTRHQIVDLYTERRGLKVDDFTFYYVFGLFRLAGIAQQIYRRYHAGETTNPAFQFFGMGAQNLCQHCRQLINEGMT